MTLHVLRRLADGEWHIQAGHRATEQTAARSDAAILSTAIDSPVGTDITSANVFRMRRRVGVLFGCAKDISALAPATVHRFDQRTAHPFGAAGG
jgi:hypothetical protein